MSEHPPQFSVKKLWIILLALTAAEVAYGEIGNRNFYEQKLLLWGGLLTFAYFKGYYIFQYFMHMKYEGAIVKGNVWFTVPLVVYLMIMIWPDTAANDKLNYEIAHQLDPMTGDIATIIEGSRNLVNQEFRYLYDDYAATHPGAEIHGEGGH
jgi:cytochrome c oxidase subunit IV